MDLATIIGLVVCFAMIIFGIVSGDLGFAALGNFVDIPSVLITVGGTFASVLVMYSINDFVAGLKSITLAIKSIKTNENETITNIINLSNVARKEGLLALEDAASGIDDAFMKKGILLVVDGTDPDLVRAILETEITCIEGRHKKYIAFWENVAAMGPAWGMVGTLIGLVNMLKDLSDVATIGPNMATALLTTLYGSMIANWIGTPIAAKLKANDEAEIMVKEVMIEGLLSIQAGENPRVIEEKLKSFLSPKQRANMETGEEGGGENVG